MSLATSISLSVRATQTASRDLSTPTAQILKSISDTLATGTAIDCADLAFADTRTLSGSTAESLDLAGSLADEFGTTITFAKIKGILIYNRTTTAGYTLAVGGAASNAFINWVANSSDIINIGPNGIFFLWAPDAAGYAVTASTGDLLKINNANAAAVTYDIILIGTSA